MLTKLKEILNQIVHKRITPKFDRPLIIAGFHYNLHVTPKWESIIPYQGESLIKKYENKLREKSINNLISPVCSRLLISGAIDYLTCSPINKQNSETFSIFAFDFKDQLISVQTGANKEYLYFQFNHSQEVSEFKTSDQICIDKFDFRVSYYWHESLHIGPDKKIPLPLNFLLAYFNELALLPMWDWESLSKEFDLNFSCIKNDIFKPTYRTPFFPDWVFSKDAHWIYLEHQFVTYQFQIVPKIEKRNIWPIEN